ncbi:MAG: hypothetical protein J2P17_20730, partial [Mycobacterium sp.]|nr:hypothetical protein [Mycobacterium sp.]
MAYANTKLTRDGKLDLYAFNTLPVRFSIHITDNQGKWHWQDTVYTVAFDNIVGPKNPEGMTIMDYSPEYAPLFKAQNAAEESHINPDPDTPAPELANLPGFDAPAPPRAPPAPSDGTAKHATATSSPPSRPEHAGTNDSRRLSDPERKALERSTYHWSFADAAKELGSNEQDVCRLVEAAAEKLGAGTGKRAMRWQRYAVDYERFTGIKITVEDVADDEDRFFDRDDNKVEKPSQHQLNVLERSAYHWSFAAAAKELCGGDRANAKKAVEIAAQKLGAKNAKEAMRWQRYAVDYERFTGIKITVEDVAGYPGRFPDRSDNKVENLTDRQREVLVRVTHHRSYALAANELHIGEKVAQIVVKTARKHLGAKNAKEALRWQRYADDYERFTGIKITVEDVAGYPDRYFDRDDNKVEKLSQQQREALQLYAQYGNTKVVASKLGKADTVAGRLLMAAARNLAAANEEEAMRWQRYAVDYERFTGIKITVEDVAGNPRYFPDRDTVMTPSGIEPTGEQHSGSRASTRRPSRASTSSAGRDMTRKRKAAASPENPAPPSRPRTTSIPIRPGRPASAEAQSATWPTEPIGDPFADQSLEAPPADGSSTWTNMTAGAATSLDNNTCGPDTINDLYRHDWRVSEVPKRAVGPDGMSGQDFLRYTGARDMQQFRNLDHLCTHLGQLIPRDIPAPNRELPLEQQPMAAAVITYKSRPDAGANAIRLRDQGDKIMVRDKATNTDIPLTEYDTTDIATVAAVLYNPATRRVAEIPNLPAANIKGLNIHGPPTPTTDTPNPNDTSAHNQAPED